MVLLVLQPSAGREGGYKRKEPGPDCQRELRSALLCKATDGECVSRNGPSD